MYLFLIQILIVIFSYTCVSHCISVKVSLLNNSIWKENNAAFSEGFTL